MCPCLFKVIETLQLLFFLGGWGVFLSLHWAYCVYPYRSEWPMCSTQGYYTFKDGIPNADRCWANTQGCKELVHQVWLKQFQESAFPVWEGLTLSYLPKHWTLGDSQSSLTGDLGQSSCSPCCLLSSDCSGLAGFDLEPLQQEVQQLFAPPGINSTQAYGGREGL